MKIKSQKSFLSMRFISGRKLWPSKISSLLKFFTLIILFATLCLMFIYYGAFLQKNQTMSKIQELIFNAAETKFSVFNNYLSGLMTTPDRLYLDVNFEGIQLLNYARESALSRGKITEDENEIRVNAKLSIGNNQYKVRLSPTGQNLDMIGDINKRAYKVRVLEGKKIYGMEEFKLIPPHSRHNMVEWVGHALENKEGLVSLRYFFVELALNGDDLGVYAIEEHFNKELLENRGAREGIIFSLKPNKIRIFNEKKISSDLNNQNLIRLLKTALQSLKNNEIAIDRVFDLEKFALQFAIIDLMNGYHAILSDNLFYYFNPITNLIEPITREYNSLRYSDGQKNSDLMIDMYQDKGNGWAFPNKLFQNKEFTMYYLKQLKRLADKKYLDQFFADTEEEMNMQKKYYTETIPFISFLRSTCMIDKFKL